jgi:phi13 family phage major tail protein
MENKVEFGLKNTHYAVVTEGVDGTYTYATPVRIPGSTSLVLTPKGENSDFYADNILFHSEESNQGYDAALVIARVPEAFRTDVLGEILDPDDKVLSEKSSAKKKKIALLFEFDGDVKSTRYVLYSCSVSRPGIGSTTKTTTAEPGTTELNLVAGPRPEDEKVKDNTTAETPAAVYDAWYSAVYVKTPVI